MSRSTYSPAVRWRDAVEAFEVMQNHAKLTREVVLKRCAHVSAFSELHPDRSPWAIEDHHIVAWLDSLPVTRATRMDYRSSLRAFYRWARNTGRVRDDPTDIGSARAKQVPVPAVWEEPLRAFRSFLRSSGHPETTVTCRLSHLRRMARDHASLAPADLSFDDLIEWMAGQRWSSEYRRSVRGSVRVFYRWMHEHGRADTDPAAKLPIVRSAPPKPRPVRDDEYQAAISKADPTYALALRISSELGLRRAEVAQIHSADLVGGPDSARLTVIGKGDKMRVLPVPAGLVTEMRERPEGFLFPGQINGHVSPAYLSKKVSALLPVGVTMHGLRHRFATRTYNLTTNVLAVQRLLGHASPATTQRYVQVDDDTLRDLVEQAARDRPRPRDDES